MVFTLMDGTAVETTLEERRHECLLMTSTKVQKLMRKTRRSRGRDAEFYVFELTPAVDQQIETSSDSTLTSCVPCEQFTTMLYRSATTSSPGDWS
jgi:hypothetical protein